MPGSCLLSGRVSVGPPVLIHSLAGEERLGHHLVLREGALVPLGLAAHIYLLLALAVGLTELVFLCRDAKTIRGLTERGVISGFGLTSMIGFLLVSAIESGVKVSLDLVDSIGCIEVCQLLPSTLRDPSKISCQICGLLKLQLASSWLTPTVPT